jgi:hypothetical protein
MRCARIAAFAGVLSFAAASLLAEDVARLAPGVRVRATLAAGGGRVVGTVLALDDKNLKLQIQERADPIVLRREDVTSLAVSDGHRSRGKGALYGTIVGAGAGALTGVVGGIAGNSSSDSRARGAIEGGLLLAFLGAPVGALVGLAIPPAERWKELPPERFRLSLAPVRGGGAAVSLTFVF